MQGNITTLPRKSLILVILWIYNCIGQASRLVQLALVDHQIFHSADQIVREPLFWN